MSHSKLLSFTLCQQASSLDQVLDLPAIEFQFCQIKHFVICDAAVVLWEIFRRPDESLPDMVAGAEVERRTVDGEVDARFEGSVERCDAIGSEEETTGVIF